MRLAWLSTFALLVPAVALAPADREVVVRGDLGAALDDYLTRCAAFGFSGCALVEVDGELVLRKGYGVADPHTGAPNTPETLYDIASASKQVTAAAILKLEAEGELSTADSIADYLPGVPDEHAGVTIDHLLTHTSGFPRMGPSGSGPSLEPAVRKYLSEGRSAEPGVRHEYWNGGYALLAGIVEKVTGEAFEDWVRDELFRPAKLQDTDFIETARVKVKNMARSHDGDQKLTTEYIQGWGYRGMGGVLTSISDLHLWVEALLTTDAILPESARELMIEPLLGGYARGWYVTETERGTRCVQHGGTSPGFQTYIRKFIDEDTLVLVLCNREGMHWQVAWGLEAIRFDQEPKVPEPPELESLSGKDAARWQGSWTSTDGGRLVLSLEGSTVQVRAQGRDAIAAMSGARPPGEEDHAWEREHAMRIMNEISEGRVETLESVLRPGIPKSWPSTILSSIWPKHVREWGPLIEMTDWGAVSNREGVQVWIGLRHERGVRAVKIVFSDRRLGILDLRVDPFPVVRFYAPVSKTRLESYAFSAERRPPIERVEKKGRRPAELRVGTGPDAVEFIREM